MSEPEVNPFSKAQGYIKQYSTILDCNIIMAIDKDQLNQVATNITLSISLFHIDGNKLLDSMYVDIPMQDLTYLLETNKIYDFIETNYINMSQSDSKLANYVH